MKVHPRVSGVLDGFEGDADQPEGSSPRERGFVRHKVKVEAEWRFIPA